MKQTVSTSICNALGASLLAIISIATASCGGGGTTAPAPRLVVLTKASTDSLAFGDERVGTSSISKSVTISNPSPTELSQAEVLLSEGDITSFSVTNGCGMSLQANSSCQSSVTFRPASSGPKQAKLLVRFASAVDIQIGLSGTGTASAATVTPDAVTFGEQLIGTISAPQSLTITNSGTAPLSIDNLATSGADATSFALVGRCGTSIEPGTSCAMAVSFIPLTAGHKSADIVVVDDASSSSRVHLAGTAHEPPPAQGIVNYGSGDPAVLLQSSLTSTTSITQVNGGSIVGSPIFDAIKGMVPGATGGAIFLGAYADTRVAGQLSIEVEKKLISQPSPDLISGGIGGSEGYDHSTAGWLTILEGRASDDSGLIGLGLTNLAAVGGGMYQTNFIGKGVHSAGKGDFIRLTLSWADTTGEIYIDGLLHNSIVLPPVSSPGRFDLGKLTVGYGLSGISQFQDHFIRNFVLANRPVTFPTHPKLSTVVIYGDSFATQSNPTVIGSTHFDATAGFQLIRHLNNLGLSPRQIVLKDYPGHVLNKNPVPGQSSFQLGENRFGGGADKLTDVLNADADYVIIMGGTNDATGDAATRGSVAPSFAADLLSMCRTLLSNPHTKGVIMQTIMSAKGYAAYATPTYVANVASVNDMIKALPTAWDTAYPKERGKIAVVDLFTATGGEAAASNMLKGTLTGALDDLHPTAFSAVISGDLIAEALQALVKGP